jgi:hypothetical protein
MYYPMRVIETRKHKLILNIAHQLPYPFASDLWEERHMAERASPRRKSLWGPPRR